MFSSGIDANSSQVLTTKKETVYPTSPKLPLGRTVVPDKYHEKSEFLTKSIQELVISQSEKEINAQEDTQLDVIQKVEKLMSPNISKIEAIKNHVNEVVEKKHFSGVVMVAHGEEIIFHEAYGMASATEKNQPNTRFHVGSVTKQFTAATVLHLMEAGKIDLNDPINKYLPEKYRSEKWKNVTVYQLLTHTGGIADYEEMRSWKDRENGFCFAEEEKMIHSSQENGLRFQPGSDMDYCNLGYTLLGCIIQNVSGISYEKYVQQHILSPLGMNSSSIHSQGYNEKEGYATGHRWNEENNKIVSDDLPTLAVTAPDGGLIATTQDLFIWTQTLTGKKQGVLKKESLEKMLTPTNESKPKRPNNTGGYGCGIGINGQRIHHSGWIPGFRSSLCVYPEKDLHIFVLCNSSHVSPEEDVSPGIEAIF